MSTFFVSDTHFRHRLMTYLRGFAPDAVSKDAVTPEQIAAHDDEIVAIWNRFVGPGDTVWHLGDVTLARLETIADLLNRLNGRKRLILGNHDRAHPMFGEKSIMAQAQAASFFEWVGTQAQVKLRASDGIVYRAMLSHFPYVGDHTIEDRHDQWRLGDTGAVLLHGHTHSPSQLTGHDDRQIHVGWDAWGRPVAEQEIVRIIEAKGWQSCPSDR